LNSILFFRQILSNIDSPVCFTHNDYQPGNILRLKSDSENYTVIDFEYCSYNYRYKKKVFSLFDFNKSYFSGFDIGNHFCEFMFDYQSAKEWPFFKVDFNLYPNEIQQVNSLK
jgi:thiamine kinase-like enzyme